MFQYYSPMTAYAMDGRFYNPPDCDTGDMHKQAIWAGAAMQKSEPHAAVMHLDFGAASYGFLHVNWDGKRFKNEDVNTQSKSVTKALQTQKDAWTIYDSHGLEQVKAQMDAGLGGGLQWGQLTQPVGGEYNLEAQQIVLEGEIEKGQTVKADSLKKARAEDGRASRGRPRRSHGRPLQRAVRSGQGPRLRQQPEVMGEVQDPPFYAGKLVASLLTMCGGLRTNVDAQVLDAEDQPIEGLYVCSSAFSESFGAGQLSGAYVPGIGHGRCVTFGRIAGINAAGGATPRPNCHLDI